MFLKHCYIFLKSNEILKKIQLNDDILERYSIMEWYYEFYTR